MPATIRVIDGRTVIQVGENTAAAVAYALRAEAAETAAEAARDELAGSIDRIAVNELLTVREPGSVQYLGGSDWNAVEGQTLATGQSSANIVVSTPVASDGFVRRVRFKAFAAGVTSVRCWTKASDIFTLKWVRYFDIGLGYSEWDVGEAVAAGDYIGVTGPGVLGRWSTSGGTTYSGPSINTVTFTDSTPDGTARYAWSVEIVSGTSELTAFKETLGGTVYYAEPVVIGAATGNPSAPTTPAAVIYSRVLARPYPGGGWIDTIDVHMGTGGGTPTIAVYRKDGDDFTPQRSVILDLAAGYHDAVPVDLEIKPGEFVGWRDSNISNGSGVLTHPLYSGFHSEFTAATTTWADFRTAIVFNTREATGASRKAALDALVGSEERGDRLEELLIAAEDGGGASGGLFGVVREELRTPKLIYIGGTGQSNMAGPNLATVVTDRQEYGALGFDNISGVTAKPLDGDDMIPYTGDPGEREYPGFGCAAGLRRRLMSEGFPSNIGGDSPILMGRNARGGYNLAQISKDWSSPLVYNGGIAQVTAAQSYATAQSLDVHHLGQMLYQGEADESEATPEATYKADLIQLAADYDTDSRAALPGAYDRITAVAQIASVANTASGWVIARAQLEACRDSALLRLAFPTYVLDHVDELHAASASHRRAGAYFARALALQHFEPLWVVDAYADGNTIKLIYNRPVTIDVALIPEQLDYGYIVTDAGDVAVVIDSVTASENVITLECGTATAGFNWRYGCAAASGMSPFEGCAGNIRDNAGAGEVFEGWPLHNWAVLQEGTV